ncbi:MAG: hypothetical protein H7Y32_04155, partial [Chloroflexales bacterium]|nr:hypothetical protein [Chloroflexales bacterium]
MDSQHLVERHPWHIAALCCTILALVACGAAPATPGAGTVQTPAAAAEAAAPITVWVDSTREGAVKLYKEQ